PAGERGEEDAHDHSEARVASLDRAAEAVPPGGDDAHAASLRSRRPRGKTTRARTIAIHSIPRNPHPPEPPEPELPMPDGGGGGVIPTGGGAPPAFDPGPVGLNTSVGLNTRYAGTVWRF